MSSKDARDARVAARNVLPPPPSLIRAKKASSLKHASVVPTENVPPPTSLIKAKASSLKEANETETDSSLKSIIYFGERARQLVILPYGNSDAYWQNSNITYFRSSGTSNEGCGWLCNTFFPTGGITTKIVENKKTVGIDETCAGTAGHLLKMSDIINNVGVFVGIEQFCMALATILEDIVFKDIYRKPKRTEFSNYDSATVTDAFSAFFSYFISEQQMKLSYQLTPPNTGLWGWRFGNFELSEFCKERWGDLPHFVVPPLSSLRILNNEDTCEFLKQEDASVNFSVLHDLFARLQGKPRVICISTVNRIESIMSRTAKGIRTKKWKTTRNRNKRTIRQNKKNNMKRK
jgi:hypothetical protein